MMQCCGKGVSAEWGKADDGGGDRGMRRWRRMWAVCVEDLRLVCWRIAAAPYEPTPTIIVGAKILI